MTAENWFGSRFRPTELVVVYSCVIMSVVAGICPVKAVATVPSPTLTMNP